MLTEAKITEKDDILVVMERKKLKRTFSKWKKDLDCGIEAMCWSDKAKDLLEYVYPTIESMKKFLKVIGDLSSNNFIRDEKTQGKNNILILIEKRKLVAMVEAWKSILQNGIEHLNKTDDESEFVDFGFKTRDKIEEYLSQINKA
jgi:hypothetical protein